MNKFIEIGQHVGSTAQQFQDAGAVRFPRRAGNSPDIAAKIAGEARGVKGATPRPRFDHDQNIAQSRYDTVAGWEGPARRRMVGWIFGQESSPLGYLPEEVVIFSGMDKIPAMSEDRHRRGCFRLSFQLFQDSPVNGSVDPAGQTAANGDAVSCQGGTQSAGA